MKRKQLLTKVLLAAALLGVGTSNVWAQTVTAKVTGFTDNGDGTYYPIYTLTTTDAEEAEVEGITYSITTPAEYGSYATLSGSTLTITGQYTTRNTALVDSNTDFTITATKDEATYATLTLAYIGAYKVTSSYDFTGKPTLGWPSTGEAKNTSTTNPRGFSTTVTRWKTSGLSKRGSNYTYFNGLGLYNNTGSVAIVRG